MQTDQAQPAPLWRRLLAALYDLLPVAALLMIATALAVLVARLLVPVDRVDLVLRSGWPHLVLQSWLAALASAYYVVSWRRGGQTIGMRAWRIAVQSDTGPLSSGRALLRLAVAVLGTLTAGIGLWWCLFDRERRMLHDLAADTRVVVRAKR